MGANISASRRDFAEALGRLEQANEEHENRYGVPLFYPEDLESLAEIIGSLDQDTNDEELDEIEDVLKQGLIEAASRLYQADPDSPGLGKKPRTPQADKATGEGIKEPYPHPVEEWIEYISDIAGGIKSRANGKIVFGNGAELVLPSTNKGPQKIESCDNPDSYARQDMDVYGEALARSFGPIYDDLAILRDREEARQVRVECDRMVQAMGDPATRQAVRKLLQNVNTFEEFEAKKADIEVFVSATQPPGTWEHAVKGVGFNLNQNTDAPLGPDGRLPETPSEMVDYLVQSAAETCDLDVVLNPNAGEDINRYMKQDTSDLNAPKGPDGKPLFYTPRVGLTNLLQNLVRLYPEDAMRYTLLLQSGERGYHMLQALPSGVAGTTNVPTAQPFIFPLVSRVYPQLILSRVGAVYPIDRPDARYYYWDDYGHKHDGSGGVNATGCLLHEIGSYPMNITSDPGEGEQSSRLRMNLEEETLTVSTRKMSAEWPQELEDRLLAYQNRDPLGEYITRMADQIAREINFKALEMMLDASDDRVVTYGTVAPTAYEQDDWDDQLHAFVQLASDKIFERRYREAAFLIADATSVTRLMRGMKSGVFQQARDTWQFGNGIQVVGSVNNFYTVIKCAWWGRDYPGSDEGKFKNKILAVARGETFSDAGIVYAPFTYRITPPLYYPGTFLREVGIIEQSALKIVIPENFARVNISVGTTGVSF